MTILPCLLAIACVYATRASVASGPVPGFLEEYASTYRYSLGRPAAIEVTREGDAVLFLRSGPRSFVRNLYEFDVATGEERLLASAEQLLGGSEERLSGEEIARRERMRMAARGIADFQLSRDGRQVLIPLSGSLYILNRENGEVRELASAGDYPIDPRFSPDGRSVATVRNGDLYVLNIATGEERRLTPGASGTVSYGLAEFVAQEEMDRMHGYWWSPDSRQIVYQATDTANVEQWHIADPTRPDLEPQEWRYPRPGEANASVRLGIVSVEGGETTWIEWDRQRYPYLATATWEENSPCTILVQNREQTEELLLAVNASDGTTCELLRETDPAWINLDQRMPQWLPDGEAFVWSSERSGEWRLELYGRQGELKTALTPKGFGYRALVSINEADMTAIVAAGADPTQQQLYRISLNPDAADPIPLSNEEGVHWARGSSKSGVFVTGSRSLEGERPIRVIRADGTEAGVLKSAALNPPFMPNVELTTVSDGPRLHAAIVRPRDFDPNSTRQYPVIVSVYGGPHAQTVVADAHRFLLNQWLADHGFIVISIDGRGTPSRGREWERAIKGNLIEVPLADQIRGLQALCKKYAEMDGSRVGVYGWSFGGYFSAMAVMQRPDVFHVGVAGAPVVDWLDYDTHYTERYMGLPSKNDEGYRAASVLSYASQLERPLLIIHGTSDDNVYFLHSAKLVDALFRAGKPYDFLPLTGFTHMVADPLVTRRLYERIASYLSEHLHRKPDTQ